MQKYDNTTNTTYNNIISNNLINDGLELLQRCNYQVNKSKSGITLLEKAIQEDDNILSSEFGYNLTAKIGYYHAVCHNYELSNYWLNFIVSSNYDIDYKWRVYSDLLSPILLNSDKEEKEVIHNLLVRMDNLFKLSIHFDNLMIMSQTFWYAYYNYNPKIILEKYANLQMKFYPEISNQSYKLSFETTNIITNKTTNESTNKTIKLGIISSALTPGINITDNKIHASSISDSFYPIFMQFGKDKFTIVYIYYGRENVNNDTENLYIPKINVHSSSIKEIQKQIVDLKLDILLFLDLHIEPIINFIALSKLAPIQICTHGHPVTTGISNTIMDYFISWEAAEIPDAQNHYTEKLELISKEIIWEYYICRNTQDCVSLLNNKSWGHFTRENIDFIPNLDSNLNWYFCPQATFKYHHTFNQILLKILQKDKKAQIIIISNQNELHNLEVTHYKRLKTLGIDFSRLIIINKLPHNELMAMYKNCNVVLDSYFFGGDTTTREAFEIGAPVVTLPSKFLGGRWTQAYYHHIGISDLIAKTSDDYVDLAVKVAIDKVYEQEMRNKILKNKYKLFRRLEAVSAWENMLIKLYQRHQLNNNIPEKDKLLKDENENSNIISKIVTNDVDINKVNINTKNIIFSCTVFLKSEDKFQIFLRTMSTFMELNQDDLHLINKFLIVMEYTENNEKYLSILKNKYPYFEYIVKTQKQQGHSKSINIIIDRLKEYTYWLHWEESWYSIGPVLKKSYDILCNTNINNLQLTKRDVLYDLPNKNDEFYECKIIDGVKIIKATTHLKKIWRYWEINCFDWSIWKSIGKWPFYSLRPSMSKVNTIIKSGYHSEDLLNWPFQCEFEWSLRWVRLNDIVIGILMDVSVTRDDDHISNYTMEHYNRWLQKLKTRECKENYNREVEYFTLKSDREKFILFYNPGKDSIILKKLLYYLEEGFVYLGDDIEMEFGKNNYNKYFIEINEFTLKQFGHYHKILVCDYNINYTHIKDNWVDEIIYMKDIKSFIDKYNVDLYP